MTTPSFSITKVESAFGLTAYLHGVLDETLDLTPLKETTASYVVIDLAGVQRVTSFGVREWIREISQLRAVYYCFARCSPSMLSQFNLVNDFAGQGELISIYLPYVCPGCEESMVHLVDLRTEHRSISFSRLPTVHCTRCGEEAEFDEIPEMYLAYVRSIPTPRPPPGVHRLLDGEDRRREFRIRKDVRGTVTAFHLSGHLDRGAYFRRLGEGLQGEVVVIASDLDGVEEDGMKGLKSFAGGEGLSVYFARVPPALFEPLSKIWAEAPDSRARVLSLRVPFRCTACKRKVLLELDEHGHERLVSGAVEMCGCSYFLEVSLPERSLEAARALPMAEAPPAVATYLRGMQEVGEAFSRSELILNKYQLVKRIGRGGEGEVFLARQLGPAEFEKNVVIKRIHRHRLEQHVLVEDFIKEARIAARLSHRNIVQILDFGRVKDEYVIAMEYVDGIDLADAIRLSRFLKREWPLEICCRVVSDLCAALQAAHSEGVIHRDVSPSNVLIAGDGTVKLADFGVAKWDDSSGLTPSGVFKGKEAYAPPEQLFGNRKSDERGDIFAAGVVLYECMTLQWFSNNYERLLKGDTINQVIADIGRDMPASLRASLRLALALEPKHRYPNARSFLGDLETILKEGRYASSEDLAAWICELVALRNREPEGKGRSADDEGYTEQVSAPPALDPVGSTRRGRKPGGGDGG